MRLLLIGMACVLGFGCSTPELNRTLPKNRQQITVENIRVSIEAPRIVQAQGGGDLRIEIENLSSQDITLHPALNVVAKLRGPNGLVVPKRQYGSIAILGTETPPESGPEASYFYTTVGKRQVLIKTNTTFRLEVDLDEYFQLDRGTYRFEVTVDVVTPSRDEVPRNPRGFRLKPEPLEFFVER